MKSDIFLLSEVKEKMRENDFSSSIKKQALKIANYRCERCWSEKDLECHHRLSLQLGGQSTPENCIILCHTCHHIAPQDTFLLQNYFLRFASTKEMIKFYNAKNEEEALKSFCLETNLDFQETKYKIKNDPGSRVCAIKDGMEKCFQEKGRTGFNIPLGYDYIDKKLVENKRESIQVRRIFDMYLHGKSMDRIAKSLNDEHIPTKQNKKWGSHTIAIILKNPLYTGIIHWETHSKQGEHQLLISQDIFNQVQEMIKKKKKIIRFSHSSRAH